MSVLVPIPPTQSLSSTHVSLPPPPPSLSVARNSSNEVVEKLQEVAALQNSVEKQLDDLNKDLDNLDNTVGEAIASRELPEEAKLALSEMHDKYNKRRSKQYVDGVML